MRKSKFGQSLPGGSLFVDRAVYVHGVRTYPRTRGWCRLFFGRDGRTDGSLYRPPENLKRRREKKFHILEDLSGDATERYGGKPCRARSRVPVGGRRTEGHPGKNGAVRGAGGVEVCEAGFPCCAESNVYVVACLRLLFSEECLCCIILEGSKKQEPFCASWDLVWRGCLQASCFFCSFFLPFFFPRRTAFLFCCNKRARWPWGGISSVNLAGTPGWVLFVEHSSKKKIF